MRHAAILIALVVFAALASDARAQTTVQLEWVGQPNPVAGQAYTYALNYTISGGGATDVTVSFDVPPDFAVLDFAPPLNAGTPTMTGSCPQVSAGTSFPGLLPWDYQCTFTAASIAPAAGSVSGTITFNLRVRPFAFLDGTPVTLSASFASNEANVAATHALIVGASTSVAIWESDINAYFTVAAGSYDPDGAGGPTAAMTGMHYRFPVRWATTGNAFLLPGQLGTLPLGPNTWLVGYETDSGAQANWSIDADPSSTAAIGQAGGVLELEYLPRIGYATGFNDVTKTYSTAAHSSRVWVQLFVPCSALGDNLNVGNPDDAPFSYNVVAYEDELAPTLDTEHTDSTTVPTSWTATPPYYFDDCGTPGPNGKTSSPEYQAPIGENMTWVIAFSAPTGDPSWTSALIVDPLPPEVELVNAVMYLDTYWSSSFDLYLCNLPGLVGQTFDLAAFETAGTGHLATAACRLRAEFLATNGTPLANPPWAVSATTHVVGYANPALGGWSDPLSITGTALGMLRPRMVLTTYVPLDVADNTVITNNAALYGRIGTTPRGPLTVSDTVAADGEANPIVFIHTLNGSNVGDVVFAPGDPIRFAFSFNRNVGVTLKSPSFDITLPPGVIIDTANPAAYFTDLSNHCGDLPGASGPPVITTTLHTGDPATPVDDYYTVQVDILNDANLYTDGCNSPGDPAYARSAFYIQGTVVANHPHVSSEALTASALLTFDNTSAFDAANDGLPANQRIYNRNFNVITGSEMRVRQVAGCSEDLGPRYVTYDYVMENTAGTHLTGMELIMTVPRIGSPVGNTIDTVFHSVSTPGAGESVAYSVDGGANWSATLPVDPATITHVRFVKDQLDAYDSRTVRLVSYAASMALGATVLSSSSLDSNELLAVPNSDYEAWSAGECPARLIVLKYFDAVAPLGTQDVGDDPLAGWTFDVDQTDGPASTSGVTGADGTTTFLVLPGDYLATEVLPTTANLTWSPTTGGLSQTVTVGLDAVYTLEFGNTCACDDGNACTDDSCASPGVCTFVATPGELCDAANLCNVCDANGACVPTVLDCGDPNTCQQPGVCNPATGGCTFAPIECAPLPIYVVVNGPNGQPAGTVKCWLEGDGTTACEMNGPYVAIDPTLWCPGL